MSFRLIVICVIVFLLGSLVGWQGHRLSKQSKLISKVVSEYDRRERALKDTDPHDPDVAKKQQHEAKGILLGQLVLNEIRAWIRDNAKVDSEPLTIVASSWPPHVTDRGEGPTMEFEIYLSRWITNPQQDELIARVKDMMRTSLVQAARLNRLYLQHTTFHFTGVKNHPEHPEWLRCYLLLQRHEIEAFDSLHEYSPK